MNVMHSREQEARDAGLRAGAERARAAGRPLLDLTESDPNRCGLGWDPTELNTVLFPKTDEEGTIEEALRRARDAVANYLGGCTRPEHVHFAASRSAAYRLACKAVCDPGDEVLVELPGEAFVAEIATAGALRVVRYALAYRGEWCLDRRSFARAVTRRARAILIGNPSQPTGAMLGRDDLAALEGVCSARGIGLIADEGAIDTAFVPHVSVLGTQCLAIQLSGLSGVCGLPALGAEWCVATGPERLVESAVDRLRRAADAAPVPASALLAIPPLLARRERFLEPLRTRLAANRAALAAAALREAPWALEWGGGGCWAVLEIGAAQHEEPLCLALLDDGVAVQPGSWYGLPPDGYLVLSLLPRPEVFEEALSRIDRRLRAPL